MSGLPTLKPVGELSHCGRQWVPLLTITGVLSSACAGRRQLLPPSAQKRPGNDGGDSDESAGNHEIVGRAAVQLAIRIETHVPSIVGARPYACNCWVGG